MQKHLIVADSIESLTFELDSSLRLSRQLELLGHKIYWTEPQRLSWASKNPAAHVWAESVNFSKGIKPVVGSPEKLGLESVDAIHMRKDPPFDMHYVMATILLDSAPAHISQFNRGSGLRSINEKVSVNMFPGDCLPSLVSADAEELSSYALSEWGGQVISKPLDLFGGRGVRRVQSKKREELLAIFSEETNDSKELRQIQPFQEAVFAGEVRCFAVGGVPIGWAIKKPAKGEFLANTRMGAVIEPHSPSELELSRSTAVAEKLRPFGIEVVGFDLIGGWISEINVTSPRMLTSSPEQELRCYEEYARMIVQLTDKKVR